MIENVNIDRVDPFTEYERVNLLKLYRNCLQMVTSLNGSETTILLTIEMYERIISELEKDPCNAPEVMRLAYNLHAMIAGSNAVEDN
jgi:hypothetical protein